jgi:hypothetical protein
MQIIIRDAEARLAIAQWERRRFHMAGPGVGGSRKGRQAVTYGFIVAVKHSAMSSEPTYNSLLSPHRPMMFHVTKSNYERWTNVDNFGDAATMFPQLNLTWHLQKS